MPSTPQSRPPGRQQESSSPVGLVPAAGRATRLGGPAASKEILRIGPQRQPVARALLEGFARAGVDRACVMIRPDKWDIPHTLGDGEGTGVRLAYVPVPDTRSICETLDRGRPFVRDRPTVLGFPDILFRPADAFARIVRRQREGGAEAVLALVPTDRPHKADIVSTGADGRVRQIEIKPPVDPRDGAGDSGEPRFTWIGAVWTPAVTELLHSMVISDRRGAGGRELYPSDVLIAGLARGMVIEGVLMPEGRHLDVGTPDDLERAAEWSG